MPRVRSALGRHRLIATIVATYVAVLAGYGLASGSPLALPYAVLVLAGACVVARIEPPGGFSQLALCGLALWGAGHLAGSLIGVGDGDRMLYNVVIGGWLHVDNIVHFVGFGSVGLAWWEATRPWLPALSGHRLGIGAAVWLAGMGAGALNEVVEFFAALLLPDTNVGGYHNTGRDLVANMLGAAVAGLIAVRRTGANPPPDTDDTIDLEAIDLR